MDDKCKILFLPSGKVTEVQKGTELLSAAISCGEYITSSCGGDGVCGRCKVIIKKGDVKAEPSGRITMGEREKGYVLACLCSVNSDLEVEVPPESRLDAGIVKDEEQVFLRLKGLYSEAEEIDKGTAIIDEDIFFHSPVATKLYLELPPPTLQDNVSDLERLYREIRRKRDIPIMQTGLSNIKKLGALLREADWRVTVTLGKRNETTEIVLIEPGDTAHKNYGIAFDIGTTTISAQLVNLNTKEVLSTKVTFNGQGAFGADVITRIIFASEKDGLERLHHAVVDNMNLIIQELIKDRALYLNDITGVTCAGNTTMMHLLLRVDPTFIRREPYIPTANFIPVIRAAEVGIKINPRGLLVCVPGVSSYAGGDITAGVLASGLDAQEELTMLIDIGTNGEIVLGNKDWLVCCSASAGPCFEGSGVSCGMRATKGAIQKANIDTKLNVTVQTIGNEKPRGICGSGYIDILAELFTRGIIDRNGKFNRSLKTERLRQGESGYEFVIAKKEDSHSSRDIVITEADIENLKCAKAAIYAASSILLGKVNLRFKDVKKFFIAGGFGTFVDIEKAITIGLLPDLSREKFVYIGNSSLIGSRETLLSYDAMRKAESIAKKMTYIELSVERSYMDEYVLALFFPHTDLSHFPSVKSK
ncbi:MAG: ASKHA domain-containing protein [Candidatus Omnitrophota bacterium]